MSAGNTTWLQFRMKGNSQDVGGGADAVTQIFMGGEGHSLTFYLGTHNDGSGVKTGVFNQALINLVELDVSQYHTYRVSLDPTGELYSLWIDDMVTPAVSNGYLPPSPYGEFYFGDGSGDVGGSVTYDYIAWNNSTAPVAVPEPASMALLGLAGLTFIQRRSRKA